MIKKCFLWFAVNIQHEQTHLIAEASIGNKHDPLAKMPKTDSINIIRIFQGDPIPERALHSARFGAKDLDFGTAHLRCLFCICSVQKMMLVFNQEHSGIRYLALGEFFKIHHNHQFKSAF